jgi:hypothetical protein
VVATAVSSEPASRANNKHSSPHNTRSSPQYTLLHHHKYSEPASRANNNRSFKHIASTLQEKKKTNDKDLMLLSHFHLLPVQTSGQPKP